MNGYEQWLEDTPEAYYAHWAAQRRTPTRQRYYGGRYDDMYSKYLAALAGQAIGTPNWQDEFQRRLKQAQVGGGNVLDYSRIAQEYGQPGAGYKSPQQPTMTWQQFLGKYPAQRTYNLMSPYARGTNPRVFSPRMRFLQYPR